MIKVTNIQALGTEYTVSDPEGNILTTIQVISYSELLSAILGPYTEEFGSYESYVEQCTAVLSGYEDIDPYRVLWFATSESEVPLSEIISYAVNHQYEKVILEHLEELDA